jgi:uncharacterized protein (DUF58 family)
MRYCLEIPRDAMRGESGIQLGHMTGTSLDFKDYREYQPGDDLRRIDWSVYGRSDKLIVKLFREEVSPHLDIIIDCSRSMALPGSAKLQGLLGLSALLAAAAGNAHCSHAAWKMENGMHPVINGSDSPSLWEDLSCTGTASFEQAWHTMPARLRRNGIRIVISDLLWEGDPLQTLRLAADGAAAVTVVQLLSEMDINPPRRGNTRLKDMETNSQLEVFIDAVAEKRYRAALHRHQQNWHHACRQVGAAMVIIIAEDMISRWQLDELEKHHILGVA